jgi:hypothetical protein
MGCNCGKKRERWIVKLTTGMTFVKSSESDAKAFADRHPGATYAKG